MLTVVVGEVVGEVDLEVNITQHGGKRSKLVKNSAFKTWFLQKTNPKSRAVLSANFGAWAKKRSRVCLRQNQTIKKGRARDGIMTIV